MIIDRKTRIRFWFMNGEWSEWMTSEQFLESDELRVAEYKGIEFSELFTREEYEELIKK